MRLKFDTLKYFDIPLLLGTLLLIFTGMALLYSTSLTGESSGIVLRQGIFILLGILIFLFFAFFDYQTISKINKIVYVILILILLYLITFGASIRGGRRWLDLGFFTLQPAEFIKLTIILGLGRLLYLKRGQINSFKTLLWSLSYALFPAILVMLEPDLGSTIIILGIWAGLVLISPIKKKYLLGLFIIFVLATGITWQFVLQDFQKNRIQVFLNPELDPKGSGYNVKQATIAVGSGQLFGRGLGKGYQSQLRFLPERQTDFIFAASSEEVGFLGSAAILGLYLFLFSRILKIAKKAKDNLGMYISLGVFFLFFGHVLINIGMNLGLLPVTGIPLPFLSAGGSSLIVAFIALGIVQNIAMQSKALRF